MLDPRWITADEPPELPWLRERLFARIELLIELNPDPVIARLYEVAQEQSTEAVRMHNALFNGSVYLPR